ncbi:MAG TPA: hypothetical protein VKQ72_09465 [Aggregatilineales bacterium]|nr:hypothetical protein [Aggregatilineales bacterium]
MTDVSERLKYCFSVLPMSAELRDYSEQVFEFIITEAVEQSGYQALRADQVSESTIAPQAIQHLSQDTLVIADLTGQSPQVFYALALRHATRKPIIHLIREGEPPLPEFPGIPTVQVNIASARDAKRCKQALISQIEAIERGGEQQDTPVSRALKRQALEQSETLLDQRASEMLKRLNSLGNSVNGLEERLSSPENIIPPEVFKLLEAVHGMVSSMDERLSQPETILPHDHVLNAIRNSGMLLNREDVDQMMNETMAYAQDAKGILNGVNPQINKALKTLSAANIVLGKPIDPDKIGDLTALATQIGESVAGIKEAEEKVDAVIQKLDSNVGALSQLYRSLSKLTI